MKSKVQSVEPNVADLVNGWLKTYKLDYKLEQESLNDEIDKLSQNILPKTEELEPIVRTRSCSFKTKVSTTIRSSSNTKDIRTSLSSLMHWGR